MQFSKLQEHWLYRKSQQKSQTANENCLVGRPSATFYSGFGKTRQSQ
ncbi:MAG: hypothetical protein ICV85_01735 [Tolypothrix sp. T3-bin4]|nr:hypothetical protein [Tolypothrix sp. T3-bin4]